MGGGKVRVERKGAAEFRRRYIGLPAHDRHKTEREVRPRIAVVELGGPSGKPCSFLQLGIQHGPHAFDILREECSQQFQILVSKLLEL